MKSLALAVLLSVPAWPASLPTVVYSVSMQWYDSPSTPTGGTLYQTGFTYTSDGFYAGGTLSCGTTGLQCGGIPFDYNDFEPWYTRFAGAALSQDQTGVTAGALFQYEQWDQGCNCFDRWAPGQGIAVSFPGAQLDELGSWTAPLSESQGALGPGTATLVITDPPADTSVPEPSTWALAGLGLLIGFRVTQFWPGIRSR